VLPAGAVTVARQSTTTVLPPPAGYSSGCRASTGAQRLQGLQQVALVGLGELGQQLGQGSALLGQQLAGEAAPCRGEPD
jgi:hypothetical protein